MVNMPEMIEKLTQLMLNFKKNASVFTEHLFMMMGIGLGVLITLKISMWML